MQLIVTGFDKFAEFDYNPSQMAVELLPETITLANGSKPIRTTRLVFKSCCQESWGLLSSELDRQPAQPTVVILTGLASRRDRINLERFALNILDYRIPDNQGHQPKDELIDPSGPEAIRTALPLPALAQSLDNQGYLCEVSNHAGAFLCNDIYYRCLRAGQQSGHPALSLFVHLPLPQSYLAAQSETNDAAVELTEAQRDLVVQMYASALAEIAKFACQWLEDKSHVPVASANKAKPRSSSKKR